MSSVRNKSELLLWSLSFAVVAFVLAAPSSAQDADSTLEKKRKTTQEACEEITRQVVRVLKSKGVNSLQVMAFEGVATGPEIQFMLRKMFAEHEIDTRVESGFSLRGECIPFREDVLKFNIIATLRMPGPGGGPIPIDKFQVLNAESEPETKSVTVVVDSHTDVVKATGANVDNTGELQVIGSAEGRINAKLIDVYQSQTARQTDGSTVFIDSKWGVQPEKNSKYSVKLLQKRGNRFVEKTAYLHKGKPFVDYDFGDVVGIRVYNHSDEMVVIDVTIDGLSVFEFSDRDPRLFAVRPGEHIDIEGWYRTNNKVNEFLIADVQSGDAQRRQRDLRDIGVVSVLFYPAWEQKEKEPKYLLTPKGTDGQNAAIDLGEVASDDKVDIELFYELETLLASIAIRYDVLVDHQNAKSPQN